MIVLLRTYAICAVGVAVSMLIGLPLPWLLGPIFACLVSALAGLDLRGTTAISEATRAVLGVAVGSTLSWAVLASMPSMWPTLAMMPALIVVCGALGMPYFQRFWGFDGVTSYYAAMPGGLSDMLIFGQEAGANIRSLSLIHTTRVMVIVVALPFLLQWGWSADLTRPPGAPATDLAWEQAALMVVAGGVGWAIAKRVGLFGAAILGPMIAAGLLAGTGVLQQRPPAEAISAAQFFIGASVGAKYSGVTVLEVRRDVAAALGFCLVLLIIAAAFTEMAILLGLAPPLDAILAFAPGGQAEMAIMAIIVGADVAFVIAHHLLRIVVVIVGAPVAAGVFRSDRMGR